MLYDVKTCRDVGKYNLYTLKRKYERKRKEAKKKAGEKSVTITSTHFTGCSNQRARGRASCTNGGDKKCNQDCSWKNLNAKSR
jgi:hypothetical protein